MGQLTNLFVSESYQGLIKLEDSTTGITENLQYLQDGLGNNLPIQVSSTEVTITGSISNAVSSSYSNFAVSSSEAEHAVSASYAPSNPLPSGIVSGSSQISYTGITDVPSGIVSGSSQIEGLGYATTSSLTTLSSSIAVTDLAQDGRLTSLEQFTSSIDSGYVTEAEFGTYTGSMNSYTSSVNGRLSSLETNSGSQQLEINQKLDSSSFNSYTSSNNSRVSSLESKTGSYATTGSNVFKDSQTISGSLNVTGEITALSASITYLKTIYQTSSIVYSSGSNILGDEASDVQTFWGKIEIPSGPVNITGSLNVTGDITGNLIGNASTATSASQAQNSVSSSEALHSVSSSHSTYSETAGNSNTAVSSSEAQHAVSSSYSLFSETSVSSSEAQHAVSASYAPSNPLPSGLVSGSSQISYTGITDVPNGIVSGSSQIDSLGFATTGSNTFNGDQNIIGNITGSSLRVENNTHLDGTLRVTNDTQINGDVTIQSATPNLKLRDTSGGGFSSGYDLRVDTGSFEIFDDTHNRDVLSDVFNTSTSKHTTSLTSENIIISGSDGVTILGPLTASGSLEGTASYATQALSASYAPSNPLPSGLVSGSSQISYTGITNVPSGIISGSSQVSFTGITDVPSGLISGSSQISGLGFATTGSNIFLGTQTITGSLTSTGNIAAGVNVTGSTVNVNARGNLANLLAAASSSARMRIASYNNAFTYDSEVVISANPSGSSFADWDNGTAQKYKQWLTLASNVNNDPLPQFKRGVGITGSLDVTNGITGSFRGDGSGLTGVTATLPSGVVSGSAQVSEFGFATTGSNTFVGNQIIDGTLSTNNVITGKQLILTGGTGVDLVVTGSGTISNQLIVGPEGGNSGYMSQYAVSSFNQTTYDEFGFTNDGASYGIPNWNGPSIYGNDPDDTYPAFIGFQNKSDWTDGRVTVLKPLVVSGTTHMYSSDAFPLYVDGTINSKRLHFTGNPFNTDPAPNLGALRFDGTNTQFYLTNYDNTDLTTQSIVGTVVQTGSNHVQTFLGANNNGTNTYLRLTNDAGVGSLTTNVDMVITGSLTATGTINGTFVGDGSGLTGVISTVPSGTISGSAQIAALGYAITGSNTFNGSQIITGSLSGNVGSLSITSNTASMDTNTANFFTLTLPDAATHILPTNIKPGQTISVKVIGGLTSTVTFPSSVKQPSGSLYVPSLSGTDILTFVSFDGTDIYMANVKKLI